MDTTHRAHALSDLLLGEGLAELLSDRLELASLDGAIAVFVELGEHLLQRLPFLRGEAERIGDLALGSLLCCDLLLQGVVDLHQLLLELILVSHQLTELGDQGLILCHEA